jgi:hypothetical protein
MNELIAENIEKIANHFGFDLNPGRKCYLGCCPIHDGNNTTALNFYHIRGHTAIGNWKCNTHGCHETFGKNAIGFIRGLLSARKHNWSEGSEETASFIEAIEWCENFFGIKHTQQNIDDSLAYMINRVYNPRKETHSLEISESAYRNSGLEFPSEYFVNRGYAPETIDEFGVGYCGNPKKPMYTRSVVPIHDQCGENIIGCLGRSVWEKCSICKSFHNPKQLCPKKEKIGIYSKWKNSTGFLSELELYNFHRAKKFIGETGLAILSEGPPNIWRLFEAGFPMSLGCFGAKFSPDQKKVLDTSGAHTIIIVPDADQASKKFTQAVIKLCKMSYNIVTIEPSYKDDIGACNIDTVQTILSPFVEKYRER